MNSLIGRALSWTSPCVVTLLGGVLSIVGITLFLTGYDWSAIGLLTMSFLTDWFDGVLARHQQGDKPVMAREEEDRLSILQRVRFRGVTNLGRNLDPAVDKIRFLGLLWVVGLGEIDLLIILGITGFAVLLTILRPIKRWLGLDSAASNRWGKIKVYAEVVLVVFLVFGTKPLYGSWHPEQVISELRLILNITAMTVLLLAFASFYTHIENGHIYYVSTRRK